MALFWGEIFKFSLQKLFEPIFFTIRDEIHGKQVLLGLKFAFAG